MSTDWREELVALNAQREQILRKLREQEATIQDHAEKLKEKPPHADSVVQSLCEAVGLQLQLNSRLQQEDVQLGKIAGELQRIVFELAERVAALESRVSN